MKTVNRITDGSGPASQAAGPGARVRRLQRRRRLVREEMVAVLVLLALLAVTVAVLATQWLSSGQAANSVGASAPVAAVHFFVPPNPSTPSAAPTSHGGTT